MVTTQGFPWPVFPSLFWGIGLLAHFLGAYGNFGKRWVDKETERILEAESRRA